MKTVMMLKLTALCFCLSFIACAEDSISEIEQYNQSTTEVETRNEEDGKCFSFNYPITLIFEDGSSVVADNRKAAKKAKSEYRRSGGEPTEISMQYPLSVTLRDGSVQELINPEDLKEIKQACRKESQETKCFTLNFPVTANVPGVGELTVEDQETFRQLRKENRPNRETKERITLVFPYSVTLQDGTILEINSDEDRESLKEQCPNEKPRRRDRRVNRRG